MTKTKTAGDKKGNFIRHSMGEDTPSRHGSAPGYSQHGGSAIGQSSHRRAGMESSVLRFKDVNFVVGSGDKTKHILQDVSGKVQWGRKLRFICQLTIACHVLLVVPCHVQVFKHSNFVRAFLGF